MFQTIRWLRNARAAFALVIIALFCSAKGLSGLFFRLTHWSPASMTCAEYRAAESKPRWVTLSDCRVDVQRGSLTGGSKGDESMVLLTTAPEGVDGSVVAVLVLDDPEYASAVSRFARRSGVVPARVEEVPFRAATTVDGMQREEFELNQAQHAAYARLAVGRGELPILVSGERPAFFGSIGYFLGAVVALALLIVGFVASGDQPPIRIPSSASKRRA